MGPGLGLGNTMGMGEISSGNIHIQNVHSEGARNSSRSGVGIGSSIDGTGICIGICIMNKKIRVIFRIDTLTQLQSSCKGQ